MSDLKSFHSGFEDANTNDTVHASLRKRQRQGEEEEEEAVAKEMAQQDNNSNTRRKRVHRISNTTKSSHARAEREKAARQAAESQIQHKIARLIPEVVANAMLTDDWALVRTWVDFRASYAAAKDAAKDEMVARSHI
jgi:hypothetical protein